MKWKQKISGFNSKMTKEKWLLLLLVGVFLMILSIPSPSGWLKGAAGRKEAGQNQEASGKDTAGYDEAVPLWTEETEAGERTVETGIRSLTGGEGGSSYEEQLEKRIREILKSVEGVGSVDVMVVLKSSGEKVVRVDRSENSSITREKDSAGGQREASSSQTEESTVLTGSGSGGGTAPIIEKEISPEISGIIISAQGGGSPSVKAEISEAMEALLGLPPHKIKVLKRAE